MSRINIFTLPSTGAGSGGSSLRSEIEAGLIGGDVVVPGAREEDKLWAFKRSVPTVVLYDEQGLRLYDGITSFAPEYYLFPDELNLLRTHGADIAQSMGIGIGRRPLTAEEIEEEAQQSKKERRSLEDDLGPERAPDKAWKPARWGDVDVGKWNRGVNGEEGLGGGFERGYDVVELGAGALRKTGHLLSALAASLPRDSSGAEPPITYLPLDLSHPELHRVLGEMDEAFGAKLEGKVECIGLHGDYFAGLKFIRDGKLPALRESFRAQAVAGLGLNTAPNRPEAIIEKVNGEACKGGSPDRTAVQPSPLLSPAEIHLATPPGIDISPLPSAVSNPSTITEETDSEDSGCQATWTPPAEAEAEADGTAAPNDTPHRPLHIVFLGSSLGNFPRDAAAPFLGSLPLAQGDTLLMGLDGRPTPGTEGNKKVELAYNDPAGHTRAFEEHGWDVVREELGLKGDAGVEFVGRYNEVLGRHEAYFRSKAKQAIFLPDSKQEVVLEEGELLNIEWSYKYSLTEALALFAAAGLRVINSWKAPGSEYRLWLLERSHVRFAPSIPTMTSTVAIDAPPVNAAENGHAAKLQAPDQSVSKEFKGVPTWEQWSAMWRLWDHITLEMIPEEMLHTKPIDLRHICLFYLGHIPTFLDIFLTRVTNGEHTHPVFFKDIFERGIDPDVDDPTKIHDHSEVPVDPSDWPTLAEILAFRDRVRQRLRGIYQSINDGSMILTRRLGRVLFMTYEHEMMHAETLLYMLIQSPTTRPPSAIAPPQFSILAKKWAAEATPNEVLSIPATQVTLGHDDVEQDDDKWAGLDGWKDHEFGWDNENPRIQVNVAAFKVDALPISNNDYLGFAQATGLDLLQDKESAPASWVQDKGEWKVRSLYGPVGFDVAGLWPLQASRNELVAYAQWKGGRLPSEPELRALWENEQGPRPAGLSANLGYKNWHPVPPQKTRIDNDGQILHGHNGGVWEWTSTEFDGHEGYIASGLYPGYSADFFDGKHYTVLGASYATPPAIAERKTFRNWFQSNYRFSFIGGRVAYDA